MNRLLSIAAGSALVAFSASAQDSLAEKAKLDAEQAMVKMRVMGAVRGTTVKGAPYAADEVTETTQVLADGTRIHREMKTSVARDSEGRVRRETPENITITDPVANVTYMLNPKTMTGQKLQMAAGNFAFMRTNGQAGPMTNTFTMTTSADGPVSVIVNGEKLDEKAMAEAMAKAKESGHTVTYERKVVSDYTVTPDGGAMGGMVMAAPAMRKRVAGEPLGKQVIEGVSAEGTRHVSAIEAGTIGNDRPITVTNESWYSDELQTQVMSKRSDPRTGDETFRLTNIRRGDPGAYLFQPPAGYQISDRK